MSRYRILFVCMGNICRSPTADGVLRHKVHARQRGYDLSPLRARQIRAADFEAFDLILAMDWDNLALVQERCPPQHQHKVRRMTEFCRQYDDTVVPDPYYGGAAGFEQVLDLVEDACDGLLDHVRHIHPLPKH